MKAYTGGRLPPPAYNLYAHDNDENCEQPLYSWYSITVLYYQDHMQTSYAPFCGH
jgi:hypothetical protein